MRRLRERHFFAIPGLIALAGVVAGLYTMYAHFDDLTLADWAQGLSMTTLMGMIAIGCYVQFYEWRELHEM